MADDLSPSAWPVPVRLMDVQRAPVRLRLEASAGVLERIAEATGVDAVSSLKAEATVSPWQDGLQVRADWRAEVTQTCGLSLEPFDAHLSGAFTVHAVPADSPSAEYVEPEGEIGLDTPDPPDVLDANHDIDVGRLVVEHLTLEVDPYPRKPGVVFEPPVEAEIPSPFAVLSTLRPERGE